MKTYNYKNDPTKPDHPDHGLVMYMVEVMTRHGEIFRGFDKTKEGAKAACRRAYYEFYGVDNCSDFDKTYGEDPETVGFILGHGQVYGAGIRG